MNPERPVRRRPDQATLWIRTYGFADRRVTDAIAAENNGARRTRRAAVARRATAALEDAADVIAARAALADPAPSVPLAAVLAENADVLADLDTHLHDGWPTGHAFKRTDDATWTHILGARTLVELHDDDHRYLPDQFGHNHDEKVPPWSP